MRVMTSIITAKKFLQDLNLAVRMLVIIWTYMKVIFVTYKRPNPGEISMSSL